MAPATAVVVVVNVPAVISDPRDETEIRKATLVWTLKEELPMHGIDKNNSQGLGFVVRTETVG